jgi:hypothetical protein
MFSRVSEYCSDDKAGLDVTVKAVDWYWAMMLGSIRSVVAKDDAKLSSEDETFYIECRLFLCLVLPLSTLVVFLEIVFDAEYASAASEKLSLCQIRLLANYVD